LKIHLHAIGCRLNQAEIETMARQLAAGGHTLTTDPAEADTVILNTCAVTAEAARDARRPVQILERRGASPDHPVLLGLPETEYLKCWVLQAL